MNEQMTRWTVVVDKKLDRDVRRSLADQGGKKGDLSNFVRQAVEAALFRREWQAISEQNKGMTEAEVMALVNDEIAAYRQDKART
jgi:Arc/MetJ-type ribon-helix-helix transcriptional regulator